MKNTAKKILALVFAVAMICTLAVPAFAAEDVDVNITIVAPKATTVTNTDGSKTTTYAYDPTATLYAGSVSVAADTTLHSIMLTLTGEVAYSGTSQSVTGLAVKNDADGALTAALKEVDTGAWVIAVNGKPVTATKNYVMQDNDSVVIYWADSVVDTKLVMVDYEKALSGIISFYYYDAEGNVQPVVGLNLTVNDGEIADALDDTAAYFTTDEAGQIWIAPATLAALDKADGDVEINAYSNASVEYYPVATYKVKSISADYDKDLAAHYVAFGACNIVTAAAIGEKNVATELFDGAVYDEPNTGDMTMVYVLVAAAAIVTLGAVVVMKKKAVKAN